MLSAGEVRRSCQPVSQCPDRSINDAFNGFSPLRAFTASSRRLTWQEHGDEKPKKVDLENRNNRRKRWRKKSRNETEPFIILSFSPPADW